MSRGGDEIEAAVHPAVRHLTAVDAGLCVEVILKLTVDVVDDRLPAGMGAGQEGGGQCEVGVLVRT